MERNRFVSLLALISGVLIALSAFLPWVTNGLISVDGLSLDGNDAVFMLVFGALVALVALRLFLMNQRYTAWDGFGDIVLGVVTLWVAVWNIRTVNDSDPLANPGAGLWLLAVASAILIVTGLAGLVDAMAESLPEENRGWSFKQHWIYYSTGQLP